MWSGHTRPCHSGTRCRFLLKQINLIFTNYSPPVFTSLRMESLQLGARAPEIVSMHTFSATPRSIVLHANLRLDGDDLHGVIAGGVKGGFAKAGVPSVPSLIFSCLSKTIL